MHEAAYEKQKSTVVNLRSSNQAAYPAEPNRGFRYKSAVQQWRFDEAEAAASGSAQHCDDPPSPSGSSVPLSQGTSSSSHDLLHRQEPSSSPVCPPSTGLPFEAGDVLRIACLRYYGRSLWKTWHQEGALLKQAKFKLLKADFQTDIAIDQAIAVFSALLSFDLRNCTERCQALARKGVESHMRRIDKLNSTKQSVVTSSSRAPILAIAAAGALFDEELSKDAKERQFHFTKNLKILMEVMEDIQFDAGRRGELLCRVLVMIARAILS